MELVPPPPPAKPKSLAKVRVAKRRLQVAHLLLRGYSVSAIADELGEKVSLIWKDKRHVLLEWRRATAARADEHQSRLLAEIQTQKREAWIAWEKSKQEQRRTKQRAAPDAKSQMKPFVVDVERRESWGDPKLLQVLQRLTALEARILGLLAPDSIPAPPQESPVYNDHRTQVLVIGDAGLPADIPWMNAIPAGRAEPGMELIPAQTAESKQKA